MMKTRARVVWLVSLTAVPAMGGCTTGEEDVPGTFGSDSLRNALAAYLS